LAGRLSTQHGAPAIYFRVIAADGIDDDMAH